jgi:hypothetical protein
MKETHRRNLLLSVIAIAGTALTGGAQAATGRVVLKIVSGGFIVGVSGGSGVLTFHGKHYPLTLGGVSVGATIGAAGAELIGTASNLHDVRDIEGAYTAVSAGVAVAGGGGVAELSNARGVVLRLKGRQVGFKVSAALSGLQISLK